MADPLAGHDCSFCLARPAVAMTADLDYICDDCAEPVAETFANAFWAFLREKGYEVRFESDELGGLDTDGVLLELADYLVAAPAAVPKSNDSPAGDPS